MKVTIIQSDLIWEDVKNNLTQFSKKTESIKENTDLIVLPEMFATGFSMKPKKFAKFQQIQIKWLAENAKKTNAIICGSIITEKNNQYFNSLIWMQPNGKFSIYNKKHLFLVLLVKINFIQQVMKFSQQKSIIGKSVL